MQSPHGCAGHPPPRHHTMMRKQTALFFVFFAFARNGAAFNADPDRSASQQLEPTAGQRRLRKYGSEYYNPPPPPPGGDCHSANAFRAVAGALLDCGAAAYSYGSAYASDAGCAADACSMLGTSSMKHQCTRAAVGGNLAGCASGSASGCANTLLSALCGSHRRVAAKDLD